MAAVDEKLLVCSLLLQLSGFLGFLFAKLPSFGLVSCFPLFPFFRSFSLVLPSFLIILLPFLEPERRSFSKLSGFDLLCSSV